jgi:ABC-type glutathione transport system ATPase component
MALLDINNLQVNYRVDEGREVQAVDDVSFSIEPGETFGLVGESGCGKTTLAKSIIRLLDANGYVSGGEIHFKGQDLAEISNREIRDVRWAEISIIPQSSMSGLNPVYKVGDQIVEAILRHEPETTAEDAHERARNLLERVGVDAERADDYAHQFSGGMKQRAMIAMALACDPDLIIADEPTTALDVIVQDQVLQELEELQEELNVAFLVISHDISVMAETCDRLGVMDGGRIRAVGRPSELRQRLARRLHYRLRVDRLEPLTERALRSVIPALQVQRARGVVKLQFDAPETDSILNWVLDRLRRDDVTIFSIEGTTPTLEEVFRRYTETGES